MIEGGFFAAALAYCVACFNGLDGVLPHAFLYMDWRRIGDLIGQVPSYAYDDERMALWDTHVHRIM